MYTQDLDKLSFINLQKYNLRLDKYADRLNEIYKAYPEVSTHPIETLLYNSNKLPENIKDTIVEIGAKFLNRKLFTNILGYNESVSTCFKENVINAFGSFNELKEELKKACFEIESGFVFLVVDSFNNLKIVKTKKNSPLIVKLIPLACIDMYQCDDYDRPFYINNVIGALDLSAISKNFDNLDLKKYYFLSL